MGKTKRAFAFKQWAQDGSRHPTFPLYRAPGRLAESQFVRRCRFAPFRLETRSSCGKKHD